MPLKNPWFDSQFFLILCLYKIHFFSFRSSSEFSKNRKKQITIIYKMSRFEAKGCSACGNSGCALNRKECPLRPFFINRDKNRTTDDYCALIKGKMEGRIELTPRDIELIQMYPELDVYFMNHERVSPMVSPSRVTINNSPVVSTPPSDPHGNLAHPNELTALLRANNQINMKYKKLEKKVVSLEALISRMCITWEYEDTVVVDEDEDD